MEGEKQWRNLNDISIPTFGASSSCLNDSVYLIGGLMGGNNNPQTVLQVRNFDTYIMNWSPVAINANHILNRAYHASAALGDSVYIFGGIAASLNAGTETVLDEVVKCTPSGLEGLKCVSSNSIAVQLKGLSASTMGAGDLLKKIILFGGSSVEGTCDSNDLMVYVGDDVKEEGENEDVDALKRIPSAGPAPDARSHHAYAVAGYRQEYLIISGGWNGAESFDDLWLCDTSNLLSGRTMEHEEVIPVKGKKAKDEMDIPQLFTWHQIHLADGPMDGRFMHGCWATCKGTLDDGLTIGIYGGMSEWGPMEHHAMLQLTVEFDGKECNAQVDFAPQTGRESDEDDCRFGFTTETIYEQGMPALIFVFGGRHIHADSQCLVLDENTDIAIHFDKCLPLKNQVDDEEVSHIKNIKYPNGDMYEGEIFVDIEEEEGMEEGKEIDETAQVRHGQGVMKYADGAVYEVMIC
jgi:hypothetical protein